MEEKLYEKNSYFSEGYVRMDRLSFPELYFPERTVRTVPRHEDTYSLLLQQHPQKLVPLGPDHQAEVPPWNPSKAVADNVQTDVVEDEGDELSGITVIPLPDSDSSECKVGAGRTNCCCNDKGSVRCVRQHIMESREKLEKDIGSDAFEELGFLEMGEAIAEKHWTEEEERIFHQTVLSNPISLDKSFWCRLSPALPSRTKREIVSYYFNVFMLQVRAEQNRFDPSGADSDNDEWHLSDEEEEDEDSVVVESPLHHLGFVSNTINDVDDVELESDEGCDDDAGKTCSADGKNSSDDSCTSFDSDAPVPEPHLKNDVHDYLWDSCDAKMWDVGYMSCRKKESDFLPTCSMIEEVFGDDSWNFKVDDKGL